MLAGMVDYMAVWLAAHVSIEIDLDTLQRGYTCVCCCSELAATVPLHCSYDLGTGPTSI